MLTLSAKIRTLSRDKALENISASGAAPRFEPEAELPTTLEGLGAELKAQRQQSFLLSVRAALAEFQAGVDWSKYRHDPENGKSLVLAIERLGLSPAEPASYLQAMEHMREYLQEAPAPVVPVVEQPKAAVVEQPKAAAASGTPAQHTAYCYRAIECGWWKRLHTYRATRSNPQGNCCRRRTRHVDCPVGQDSVLKTTPHIDAARTEPHRESDV